MSSSCNSVVAGGEVFFDQCLADIDEDRFIAIFVSTDEQKTMSVEAIKSPTGKQRLRVASPNRQPTDSAV